MLLPKNVKNSLYTYSKHSTKFHKNVYTYQAWPIIQIITVQNQTFQTSNMRQENIQETCTAITDRRKKKPLQFMPTTRIVSTAQCFQKLVTHLPRTSHHMTNCKTTNCAQIGSNSRLTDLPSPPLPLFEALAIPTDPKGSAKKALTTMTPPCLTTLLPYFCAPWFRKIATTVWSIASYFERLLGYLSW